MSTNRDAFDRAIAAFNNSDLDRYLELYDPSLTLHGYSEQPMGKQEAEGFYQGILSALSDIHLDIFEVVEEGDMIAARFTMTGTHSGELSGVPATGLPISQNGMTIMRFSGGKVVERWSIADFLSVLMQIGAMPAPA